MEKIFLRNIEYDNLFEYFFLSAVVAILVIRFFLHITGYPQVAGGHLHIAHMLWGGLFMAVAILMLVFFLSNDSKRLASILGGIGFGTFIDELGKFITRDNNYFYQPSIAIIYSIFILLYLLFRVYKKRIIITPDEYTINSLEYMKEAIIHNLDQDEKKRALSYLARGNQSDPIVQTLQTFYKKINALAKRRENIISETKNQLGLTYHWLLMQVWFSRCVILFFLLSAIGTIFIEIIFFLGIISLFFPALFPTPDQTLSVTELISLSASALSGLFIIVGAFSLRHSRYRAYRLFKRSILVTILLSQVFAFYTNQISAVFGLCFYLFLLAVLNFMIDQEHTTSKLPITSKPLGITNKER